MRTDSMMSRSNDQQQEEEDNNQRSPVGLSLDPIRSPAIISISTKQQTTAQMNLNDDHDDCNKNTNKQHKKPQTNCLLIRQPLGTNKIMRRSTNNKRNQFTNRFSRQAQSRTLLALCTIGLYLLLTISMSAGADYAPASQQNHEQPAVGYNGNTGNGNGNNEQPASKQKKIQIVYIKVPLAKLKPSLGGNESASYGNQSSTSGQYDSAEQQTKLQGSQSVSAIRAADHHEAAELLSTNDHHDDQAGKPMVLRQQQQQQAASFLIPMAVIQGDSGSFEHQQSSETVNFAHPVANFGDNFNPRPEDGLLQLHGGGYRGGANQPAAGRRGSPMQLYQQMIQQSASVNHGINHGFMSSFLLGEKEKLNAAALRQLPATMTASATNSAAFSPAHNSPVGSAPPSTSGSASAAATSAAANATANTNTSGHSNSNSNSPLSQPNPQAAAGQQADRYQLQHQQAHGPGGLMPNLMMPFSMMPDNMIGQAYNAAVGQALPLESGSPSSLLSSPSTAAHTQSGQHQAPTAASAGPQVDYNKQEVRAAAKQAAPQQQYGGGSTGTVGDANSSPGIGSSGSYGANGPNQPGSSTSGSGYQQSASGYANSGPSSGYGSGIKSFGASVAFSDFPTIQSDGLGQQMYGQQQQSSSSNNNNNYNTNYNTLQSSQVEENSYAGKLRQAKKTIIPIVVQVEHAILEQQQQQHQQQLQQQYNSNNNRLNGNKYGSRGLRQAGGNRRGRGKQQEYRANQVPYGAASNEMGAQYINAANAQDINQITAAINAENAASAAAALAQADMAFGTGSPAYIGAPPQGAHGSRPPMVNGNNVHNNRPNMQQYSAAMQSAASALLANTHPVLQAAASGGLASVSKLGAKLGEIMALPSMQVPNTIQAISSSLPSTLTNIGTQVGMQLNQAVQQVAKEHPTAHAFARQVAQQAGISLPSFPGQQQLSHPHHQQHQHQHHHHQQQQQQQQQAAASSPQQSMMSPAEAQIQNMKLSIGQNLQTAAAQLMGISQKANAQSLLNSPLAALYPPSMNAALKQLSALSGASSVQQQQGQHEAAGGLDPHHAQSSSLMPVQQQPNGAAVDSSASASGSSGLASQAAEASSTKQPAGKQTLKSKFLSFFQPPKFISSLLSWNDRADERNDSGEPVDIKMANNSSSKAAQNSKAVVQEELTATTKVQLSSTSAASGGQTSTTLAASSPSSQQATETTRVTMPVSSASTSAEVAVTPAPSANSTSGQPK